MTKRKASSALLLFFSLFLGVSSSAANFKTIEKFKLFDEEIIHFDPNTYNTSVYKDGDILRMGNGRILLKKVRLPKSKRDINLSLTIKLQSNGDRWDKTGSCFVIPAESDINMIKIANGEENYPAANPDLTENLVGVIKQENYLPTVELMRFMTPFGVGHYSSTDSISLERRKPIYVDKWAPHVEWTQDISDRYSLLTEDVYVGVFVDTWTNEGYKLSVEFELKESEIKADKLIKKRVLPLVNTVYYQGQDFPDLFNRQPLNVVFDLPKKAKNVQLKYIVTGHGGLSGGDEFVQNENIISIDGEEIYRFTPWRDDCASFRRFNPSTGVWLMPREAAYISKEGSAVKLIDEAIASSDLSRSNWCPGSDVDPVTLYLDDLTQGKHKLTIAIPNAQSAANNTLNHWLVSAYLVWEE